MCHDGVGHVDGKMVLAIDQPSALAPFTKDASAKFESRTCCVALFHNSLATINRLTVVSGVANKVARHGLTQTNTRTNTYTPP